MPPSQQHREVRGGTVALGVAILLFAGYAWVAIVMSSHTAAG